MKAVRTGRLPATPQSDLAREVQSLRRTLRDVVALSALPSIWVDCDLRRSIQNLTDVLRAALRALTVLVRVKMPDGSEFSTAASEGLSNSFASHWDAEKLLDAIDPDAAELVKIPRFNGSGPLNALPHGIFFDARRIGRLVACYKSDAAPSPNDSLLLQVAANQIALLFQRHKDQEERLARKLAENALRSSEARIQSLLTLMPAAVYSCDAEGRITFYNRRAVELWGCEPKLADSQQKFCAAYKCWFDGKVLAPEETPMAVAVKEGKAFRNLEPVFERPDGKKLPVLVNIDPLFDADGKPAGAINVFQDVTPLKRVQDELKSREEYLRAIVENTPECVKLVAEDGTLLGMNGAGLSMVEAACAEQVIGKSLYDVIAPEHRSAFRAMNRRVCGGSKERLEFEIVGMKGTRRWMETCAAPIVDPVSGRTVQLAVTRNITERRNAELELQRKNAQLAAFLETAALGVHRVGPDGIILWANDAELQMLGYSREEYIGHSIKEFHADEPAINDILKRLSCGDKLYGYEARLKCKDGSIKDVLIDSSVLWEDGKFIHTQCFTRDVTEKKRTEEALRASEERYRQLLSLMPSAVYTCDREGRITFFNRRAAELWGREPELNGSERFCACYRVFLPDGTFVPPNETPMALAVQEGRAFRNEEATVERPDGSRFIASVNIDPIRDEAGKICGAINVFQDITEQKRTEETIQRQTNQLRLVTDHAPVSLAHCDREGRYLFVNETYAARFGMKPEELNGKHIREILGERAFQTIRPHMERVLGGESVTFETEIPYARIGSRWMYVRYEPDRDAQNNVRGLVAAIADITDRRRADEALRQSEERFRLATRAGAVGVWDWDVVSNKVTWSDSLYEIHGLKRHEFAGTVEAFAELIHPDDRPAVQSALENALRGTAPYELEFRSIRPDGKVAWIYTTAQIVWNGSGEPIRMLGSTVDITRRRAAEEKVRESEQRYRQLMSLLPAAVYTCDTEGRISFYNRRAAELWGSEPSLNADHQKFCAARKCWFNGEVIPPDETPMATAVREGKSFRGLEPEFERPDGTRRAVLVNIDPLFDANGNRTGAINVFQDITERKQAEEALRESEALLEGQKDAFQAAMKGSSLEESLEVLVRRAIEFTGGHGRAAFYLTSPDGKALHHIVGMPEHYAKAVDGFPISGESMACGLAVHTGRAVISRDVEQDPSWDAFRWLARHHGFRACWSFPVHTEESPALGTLAMYFPEPREPTPREMELVKVIAHAATVIISRHQQSANRERAEQALRKRGERLQLLSDTLAQLLSARDPDTIVRELFPKVAAHLGVDTYFNFMVNREGTALKLHSCAGIDEETARCIERLDFGQAICGTVAQTRAPIHATDIQNSDYDKAALVRGFGIQCYACNPLIVGDRLLGTLSFASRTRKAFDADELQFLSIVSQHAAVTLDRLRNAETLRESEERFRTLADNINQLAWMTDKEGWIFWYNRRWFEYTGTTLEQMQGWGWETVHHPEHIERVKSLWRDHLQRGAPWEDTFPLRGADGAFRWFLSRAVPIRDGSGQIVRWFGTNTDVTELREAQAQLNDRAVHLERLVAERTASLREAVEQMEEFSYSVSHDLRGPLRAMNAYAGVLLEEYGTRLDGTGRSYLEKIRSSSDRMNRLTQDVLAYSRVARSQAQPETIDLERLVRDVIHQHTTLQPPAAEIEIAGPLPPVLGHETTLAQSVSNLLNNAVKFVAPGIKPHVRVRVEPKGQQVRVWFEDNGIGVKPEHQQRIFNMFERVHPQGMYEGTGIGLTIVRKAIEKMGGRVGIESDGQNGSRFWIELRQAD